MPLATTALRSLRRLGALYKRGQMAQEDAASEQVLIGAIVDSNEALSATQMERARALLAAIIASSEDAIVSKTLDGIVTSWNGAAERLFGFTAADMIGKSITRIIPADLQHEEVEILAKIRQGERIE